MKDNEPLITLIIPVYNVKPYLRQCLDSAVSQSYGNLEIIVVDDGSTDGSDEICDEYAAIHPQITLFHSENRGVSAARNYGLDHMNRQSQFVAFLDSDDWLEFDAIQKLYDAVGGTHADIVCCRHYIVDNNDQKSNCSFGDNVLIEGNRILKDFLTKIQIGQTAWNKLYSVDLFASIRYPVGMFFEDIATTYKCVSLAQRIVVIPNRLYHYRIRRNSLSRDYSMKSLIDYWEAYYGQYKTLSAIIQDSECLQILTQGCLLAVNRMCRGYGGCTTEEKKEGKLTVEHMREFVGEHRQLILHGNGYSKLDKLTCITVSLWNPFLMWGINKLYVLFRFFKQRNRLIED